MRSQFSPRGEQKCDRTSVPAVAATERSQFFSHGEGKCDIKRWAAGPVGAKKMARAPVEGGAGHWGLQPGRRSRTAAVARLLS
jgi:hypothetical protein